MSTALRIAVFMLTASTALAQTVSNTVNVITPQAFAAAALNGQQDLIEKGLQQGIDVNSVDPEKRPALMYAAFEGRTEIVQLLIQAGADVNLQDASGSTALMFAASSPKGTDAAAALLDAGAAIDTVDSNEHYSALMWAAAEGRENTVKLLLKRGADPALQDADGDTAASFAAQAGHSAVIELLKNAGSESAE